MTKQEAERLMIERLTKQQALRVLEHVPQHFWPPRPTRQTKGTLTAAIVTAWSAGRYDFQLQDIF
jgi:hypothetical protein